MPRHFAIIELCLAGENYKNISQATGLTPQAVSNICNSPLFQDAIAKRRAEQHADVDEEKATCLQNARDLLENNATKAVQVHVDLLASAEPRTAQRSANAILDRVFTKGPGVASGAPVVLNAESILLLQVAMVESREGLSKIGGTD